MTYRNDCRNAAISGGVLSMIAMLTFGCGGDANTDPSAVDTGLASSRALSTLTIAESTQLCEATSRAVGDMFDTQQQLTEACTVEATFSATEIGSDGHLHLVKAACEQERNKCIAEGAAGAITVQTDNCKDAAQIQSFTGPCSATVEEFERCATAAVRVARDDLAKLDCAYLATQPVTFSNVDPNLASDTATTTPSQPTPPECAAFEAKCGSIDLAGF